MEGKRDDIDDEMDRLFELAQAKRSLLKEDKFSAQYIKDISLSLDEPINGILGYLATKASRFYGEFECEIDGPETGRLIFTNSDKFPNLNHLLKAIRPGSYIQVNYRLKQPNEEYSLKEIHERIDILLESEGYKFKYTQGNGTEAEISVDYDQMITIEQIETLRNLLFSSVMEKVAGFIDG